MRIEHTHKLLLIVLIGCVVAVLSAGCITAEKQIIYNEVPVNDQTEEVLAEFAKNLRNADLTPTLDLYYLSDQIGRVETEQDVHDIIVDYYAKNIWMNRVVYYDNATGSSVEAPISSQGKISDIVPVPTEKDFIAAGGVFGIGPVYIPDLGWMELVYAPVFSPTGEYKGCLLVVAELYHLLEEHELLSDTGVAYGNYTVLLTNHEGVITYATQQEYIGTKLEKGVPNKIGDSIIVLQDGVSGAYQYAGDNTSITTAWEKTFVHKNEFTIYLTKKEYVPAVSYEDQFTPEPDQMRSEVTAVWRYAVTSGSDAAMKRINEGFYFYEMYAVSSDGTILAASPEKKDKIGLNYINVRGRYGTSYMDHMITTAQQGGGYVTYFKASDDTQIPEAGLFTIAYVMPVNDDWFIVGVSPGSTNYTKINNNLRGDVVAVARAVVGYAHDNGIESVIEKIVDNPGANGTLFTEEISTNISDLTIMDYNGTVYANLQHPEMAGENAMHYTDLFGASTIRKSVINAKSGGGISYDYQWNETPGYADLWLCSIEPIDDTYFVMAGTPVITTENYVKAGFRK
ncbi:hypothetical protein [Methanorbis rubei]|uniref:Cache domain-containing protein n=1 Tax=Methanorbis rubei TaxID=3028300 RepID=A0AAE4MFB7_9EURY|nr:hypothetical protein [Methanocorpusculaceae archaeon Cs1]